MRALLAAMILSPGAVAADKYVEGGWELLAPVEMERTAIALEKGAPDPQPVAILEKPPVEEARYLIAGEVKYEGASGYLEMWSIFGNGRFFSRTMGEAGPMAKLEGTADWRPFMLPFNAEPGMVPRRLEMNVVLPGGGRVELRNVSLYQTGESLVAPPVAFRDAFWDKVPGLSLVFIIAAATAYFWGRCIRKKRAERELRAMTASDIRQ